MITLNSDRSVKFWKRKISNKAVHPLCNLQGDMDGKTGMLHTIVEHIWEVCGEKTLQESIRSHERKVKQPRHNPSLNERLNLSIIGITLLRVWRLAAAESILSTRDLLISTVTASIRKALKKRSKTNIWAPNQKTRKSKEGILI